jgi:hypothetical protein
VLRPRLGYDPHGLLCLQGGEVGDQLSEVVVITLLQLVLDDDERTRTILCYQIDAEVTAVLLTIHVGERQVQHVTEDINVVLQPRRELQRLVLPHVTKLKALDFADHVAIDVCCAVSLNVCFRRHEWYPIGGASGAVFAVTCVGDGWEYSRKPVAEGKNWESRRRNRMRGSPRARVAAAVQSSS